MQKDEPATDILVVDDNRANVLAIEAALGDLGGRVVRAHSGTEALRQLFDRDFALVLLDVKMPSMDGFETARMIRARKRSRHTPIVFMTAYDRDDRDVLAAYELGAVDFLFKPIEPAVLRAKASVFVELQVRTAEVAHKNAMIREHERREHERTLEKEREHWEAEALRRQMEQLAEADRHKDRFLALLGHELRNPLASVAAGLEVLKAEVSGRDDVGAVADQTLAILDRQTRHLTRLVDDLLDLSRIQSGKIELRECDVSLRDVVEQAVHACQPLVDEQQQILTTRLPDFEVQLRGDPVRLVQVFSNLLHNAVRYTPKGGSIDVTASCEDDQLELRVRDTGRGMSAAFLPHAFDALRQEAEHSDNGLGLGLALVRQIVTLHRGTVEANSPGVGLGTEIVVKLPARRNERPLPSEPQPRSTPRSAKSSRSLLILLIDDSADVRELMAELLRSWGHRVEAAEDGITGVQRALEVSPDVAIVDIALPELDGYAVARRLREELHGKPLKLIAMTGFGRESDRHRAREAGFDQHIVKPASIEALRQALALEESHA